MSSVGLVHFRGYFATAAISFEEFEVGQGGLCRRDATALCISHGDKSNVRPEKPLAGGFERGKSGQRAKNE